MGLESVLSEDVIGHLKKIQKVKKLCTKIAQVAAQHIEVPFKHLGADGCLATYLHGGGYNRRMTDPMWNLRHTIWR